MQNEIQLIDFALSLNSFILQGYSRLTEAEPDIIAGGTRSQWEERGGGKYGCWGKVSAYKLNGWEYYATKFHSLTFIKASVV